MKNIIFLFGRNYPRDALINFISLYNFFYLDEKKFFFKIKFYIIFYFFIEKL